MLPSSTYAKTSALCRWAGATSPGARITVSTRTSRPGTSVRALVIKGVSFATCASALRGASNMTTNNGNSGHGNAKILFMYQLLTTSARSCLAYAARRQASRERRERLPGKAQSRHPLRVLSFRKAPRSCSFALWSHPHRSTLLERHNVFVLPREQVTRQRPESHLASELEATAAAYLRRPCRGQHPRPSPSPRTAPPYSPQACQRPDLGRSSDR